MSGCVCAGVQPGAPAALRQPLQGQSKDSAAGTGPHAVSAPTQAPASEGQPQHARPGKRKASSSKTSAESGDPDYSPSEAAHSRHHRQRSDTLTRSQATRSTDCHPARAHQSMPTSNPSALSQLHMPHSSTASTAFQLSQAEWPGIHYSFDQPQVPPAHNQLSERRQQHKQAEAQVNALWQFDTPPQLSAGFCSPPGLGQVPNSPLNTLDQLYSFETSGSRVSFPSLASRLQAHHTESSVKRQQAEPTLAGPSAVSEQHMPMTDSAFQSSAAYVHQSAAVRQQLPVTPELSHQGQMPDRPSAYSDQSCNAAGSDSNASPQGELPCSTVCLAHGTCTCILLDPQP